MKAIEITIVKVICSDDGISNSGPSRIPTDCIPSKGDQLKIDGVLFTCTSKVIELSSEGIAKVSLTLDRA